MCRVESKAVAMRSDGDRLILSKTNLEEWKWDEVRRRGKSGRFPSSDTASRSGALWAAEPEICVDRRPTNISGFVVIVFQHCVPQSSSVIKQLRGSVNLDDRIENDTNLCASLRVAEGFGAMKEKQKWGWAADQDRRDWTVEGGLCLPLEIAPYTSATPHRTFHLKLRAHREKFLTVFVGE